MSRTTYLKIFNYDNQSCSRKYKLLLHPFASNFYLTSNTHRRFWGCRDPAADRNLVLTFYFGLALPTLSTVLTVYTQTANRVVLLWCSQITQLYVVHGLSSQPQGSWVHGQQWTRIPQRCYDLHGFVIYMNSNEITLQIQCLLNLIP